MKTYKSSLPEISLKYKKGTQKKVQIRSSVDAAELLRELHDAETFEIFESAIFIFLNRANNTIGWIKHSSGGSASVIIDIKLVMSTALQCGAHGIIFSHNHPSGSTKPSNSDIEVSKKLQAACKTLEMTLLDSIVITMDSFTSLKDESII